MSTTSAPEMRDLVIGAGYSAEDRQRLTYTLEHLLPYLNLDSVCISGGVATAAQLSCADKLTEPRPLNDIDIVINSIADIWSEGITQAFKIEEIELNDPVDDLFVKMVDKQTGLKVDIFGATRFPPEPEPAQFGEHILPIRSAPNIGALLLCATDRRIRRKLDIIPKQFIDLLAVLGITGMAAIGRNWNRFPHRTIDFDIGPHRDVDQERERYTSERALFHVEEFIKTTSDPLLAQLRKP